MTCQFYDGRVSLRYAALGLLAQQPGSGYDLLKRFENSMANVWPATQSQLYGELNKLADAGLIEVGDIGPRGRKEYRVTEAGRQDLLRWLTDPGADPPFRSAGLLRIFLLGAANGAFAVAAVGTMMILAGQGRTSNYGMRMGVWGAAQAIAFGLGGVLGTVALDLGRWLTASDAHAFAAVFSIEASLFLVSAIVATRIGRQATRRSARMPDAVIMPGE